MRTIATLREPDTGQIHIRRNRYPAAEAELRKTLGCLPQEFWSVASANVGAGHVKSPGAAQGDRERQSSGRRQWKRCCITFNLWEPPEKRRSPDSRRNATPLPGLRRRCWEIPQLLIVDEPTADSILASETAFTACFPTWRERDCDSFHPTSSRM